ncbi:MAG TPA: PIN-like domain-containing protein [Solirubrobacterales bacterium]|nr:PIN-like domain-containing protein [Solirubrobacterales bacterium]
MSEVPRGIFDGFEAYRTPTLGDYKQAFESGMVVPDANVLLNLYRYTDGARDDLFSVLERLGDRLWAPHQALAEFWRNRDSVLRDPRGTERIQAEMSTQREKASSTLRAWANRVSMPQERVAEMEVELCGGFEAVIAEVGRFNDESAIESARDTDKDAVLTKLEEHLRGKVGRCMDDDAHAAAVAEGMRRVEEREPPGYLDKNKEDTAAAGDYLVWEQVLIEAQRRKCDVVFVTADVKEDWWRREAGELRGPRLELAAELRQRADARLFMLRPTDLLGLAREVLEVTVQDDSVEDADRVDRLPLDRKSTSADGGWTADAVEELLVRLREEGAVQGTVIEQAAHDGGFVERETVYELAGYDEDRQLKGFTRPVNRIARDLREEGRIDEGAVDLLTSYYDPFSANPSEAAGFQIDPDVLAVAESAVRS